MRPPHAVTVVLVCSFWIIVVLLWQVHVERRKNAALTGAVRQYIHGAAQINSALEIVSGRLNQCEAITY